ncbi:MAG: hypothetical protein EU548_04770 [Promethearchaeota archaeon]|nr:MAG: hypothetical protein EU548_04770 [Candidatus Lokiarchaeota archaeon]
MLFQDTNALMFILWLILATVIVTLVIYLSVRVIESEHKASDKKLMIVLTAFIAVLVLPIIEGVVALVLGTIGNMLAMLRNTIDGGGANYLINLVVIVGFLILLLVMKLLIDLTWENAVWITLLTLFVLYIIYSLIPELYTFIRLG